MRVDQGLLNTVRPVPRLLRLVAEYLPAVAVTGSDRQPLTGGMVRGVTW
jgi:hypothetical protein